MYRKQALRLLALVGWAIKTISPSSDWRERDPRQTLQHTSSWRGGWIEREGRARERWGRRWRLLARERKRKKGLREGELWSFFELASAFLPPLFSPCLFSLRCFSYLHSPHPAVHLLPPCLCSPPLLHLCAVSRSRGESTWDFPTAWQDQTQPHAHSFSVSPSTSLCLMSGESLEENHPYSTTKCFGCLLEHLCCSLFHRHQLRAAMATE